MIGAMAVAGRRFARGDLVDAACRAADFVRTHMTREGRLLHFYAEGAARIPGMLDDYAFFGRGCLEAFFAGRRRDDFESARACADSIVRHFEDDRRGGFYSTADDARELIVRPRDHFDGAVPSGYSVATELLLRLHQLTGIDEYRRAGEAALAAALKTAQSNPHACAHLLCVAQQHSRGYVTIVIAPASHEDDGRARVLEEVSLEGYFPGTSVLPLPSGDPEWMPSAAIGKTAVDGRDTAYVCRGQTCEAPVTDPEALLAALRARGA
jgi:uncharacterized protein YyaL (SSP411 family)